MSSLKAKIVQHLDDLPENTLQQVFDYIEFLNWRKENIRIKSTSVDEKADLEQDAAWLETDLSNLGEYEPYEWQEEELNQGFPIEIDLDRGIVAIQE